MSLLEVHDLEVVFKTATTSVHAVNGVSFELNEGEILSIVGESGSGKSQTAYATMGLLSRNAEAKGSVFFDGVNLMALSESELIKIRATQIAMIFQNPMTSLNPYMRISEQMTEVLTYHRKLSKPKALEVCIEMLEAVQIPDSKERISMFPHECSGGMRQRILIAMSLLCRPRILIADEPTTALDVTIQAQIVELLKKIRRDFKTAILIITHDLGLVAGMSDRIIVMYGGQIMESGPTDDIFAAPNHPYTVALLEAVPRLDRDSEKLVVIPGDPLDARIKLEGCPFEPRCKFRLPVCKELRPTIEVIGERTRACHLNVGTFEQ